MSSSTLNSDDRYLVDVKIVDIKTGEEPCGYHSRRKMTQFELIRLLGFRADELAMGKPSFLKDADVPGSFYDPIEIARKELLTGKLKNYVVLVPENKPKYKIVII